MPQFIVFRHGFNAANQSARDGAATVAVARVEADTPDAAAELALRAGVTCYHNQHLSARPESDVIAEDADLGRRVQVLHPAP